MTSNELLEDAAFWLANFKSFNWRQMVFFVYKLVSLHKTLIPNFPLFRTEVFTIKANRTLIHIQLKMFVLIALLCQTKMQAHKESERIIKYLFLYYKDSSLELRVWVCKDLRATWYGT